MKKSYKLDEIDCAHCAAKMETAIRALDGVASASINFLAQKLTIEFADGADEAKVLKEADKACRKVDPDCHIVL